LRLDAGGTQSTFSNENTISTRSVATQCDGRVLVAGLKFVDGGNNGSLGRLLPTGAVDTAFGSAGAHDWESTDGGLVSVLIQDDGRIVVAGNERRPFVARLWP
jgi:hypothetical protein